MRVAHRRVEALFRASRRTRSSTIALKHRLRACLRLRRPAPSRCRPARRWRRASRSASAKLSPAEIDDRSVLANVASGLLASSLSVASAASSVSPAPTRSASWRRNRVSSRGRGSFAPSRRARAEHAFRRELGVDRQMPEVLDSPDDLLARGRLDLAEHDLPGLGHGAVSEMRHVLAEAPSAGSHRRRARAFRRRSQARGDAEDLVHGREAGAAFLDPILRHRRHAGVARHPLEIDARRSSDRCLA